MNKSVSPQLRERAGFFTLRALLYLLPGLSAAVGSLVALLTTGRITPLLAGLTAVEEPRVFRTRECAVILRGGLHFQVLIHGLLRGPVPECGMKTLPIVAQLDVARDVFPCLLACRVDGTVYPLDFERSVE